VKKTGEEYDELHNAYFVPASELGHYSDEEKFIPQPDPDHPGRTVKRLKHYPRGTFIYRLAGRNREKSASYYTPEVLTQCVVKYALKELLKDKTADDMLQLTLCEPAMGSGAFLNEAITQLTEAYLKAKQLETGERLGHDEYGQELQKVKAYIAANNVYGVDRNPVAVELAEVSLWLNTIHPGCPVPWFNMQLVAGNSLIGARRQAFASRLLRPNKGEPSWLDEVPERYPLGQTPRPDPTVYHFLLPDTGMANYNDKVVKQMASAQLEAIKKWRTQFCKPFEPHHIAILERLSARIDQLWHEHITDRRQLRELTRDAWDVFGYAADGVPKALTTQEKDRLFNDRILSRIDASSSAYRRLKLVMDYWCALWFWPIEQAHMLPTREEFLLELQSIIEGGVVEVTPIEGDQFLLNIGNTPVQQELDLYEERGYVNLNKLCRDYPRLALVQELAERYRFHHWELEFADLFVERGGFDLILGNPPWIKVEWSEGGVLGDINPRFVFDQLSASALNKLREEALTKYSRLRADYLVEFEEAAATQNFLNSYQNYSILESMKANLYKCFLPQAWYIGSSGGMTGFLHPEGVYDDPQGGAFREWIYPRLRYHFQFRNEFTLFEGTNDHGRMVFGIHIYRNTPAKTITFNNISLLFWPTTIDQSFSHTGAGELEGIKDSNDQWNINGHRNRIVVVDEIALNLFARLYDESGTPGGQARLPVIFSQEIISVLEKFARHLRRLSDLKSEYFSTQHWNETLAQDDGTIRRDTQFPQDVRQWILSGPHFYVGNPLNKTPRRVCTANGHYDPLDLTLLADAYLPRTNYVPACDSTTYRNRTPKSPWDGRPVTEFYRFLSREMLSQAGEHTLVNMILPKGAAHVHTCITRHLKDTADLLDLTSMALSIVSDFHIKSTGAGHANVTVLNQLPLLLKESKYRPLLHLRALLLNCLTTHYTDLWAECWKPSFREDGWAKADPHLLKDRFRNLTPDWTRACALRTDFDRRQALVEIDVLAAMALGLTCDELCAIYRIQFPVLRQNEADTWYDQNGRIVFTCSKGLPGVGLDRPQWEHETHLEKLEAAGLRIEGIAPSDFSTIKKMPHSTVTRTVVDDTIADYRYAYGTFRKNGVVSHCPCPDYPEPIEGPVERDITYIAPFTRCDREDDYRTVWHHFAERMRMEEGKTQAPVKDGHARAEILR
jgi:hypothetical protein